jgi:phosphoribosylamine--glycine ligase
VTVVLASGGYPSAPTTGQAIDGLDALAGQPDVVVFHAGTARGADGSLVTAGGRVLDVTAWGPTVADARHRAYDAARTISWPGVQYRRDIAAAA